MIRSGTVQPTHPSTPDLLGERMPPCVAATPAATPRMNPAPRTAPAGRVRGPRPLRGDPGVNPRQRGQIAYGVILAVSGPWPHRPDDDRPDGLISSSSLTVTR